MPHCITISVNASFLIVKAAEQLVFSSDALGGQEALA